MRILTWHPHTGPTSGPRGGLHSSESLRMSVTKALLPASPRGISRDGRGGWETLTGLGLSPSPVSRQDSPSSIQRHFSKF